jgi:uncharacterized protein (DUF1778 family)
MSSQWQKMYGRSLQARSLSDSVVFAALDAAQRVIADTEVIVPSASSPSRAAATPWPGSTP